MALRDANRGIQAYQSEGEPTTGHCPLPRIDELIGKMAVVCIPASTPSRRASEVIGDLGRTGAYWVPSRVTETECVPSKQAPLPSSRFGVDEKQLVRGEKKWYVDFDKCVPYFVKTLGCSICIEVCPWSEPGRGPKLSQRLLARRSPLFPSL